MNKEIESSASCLHNEKLKILSNTFDFLINNVTLKYIKTRTVTYKAMLGVLMIVATLVAITVCFSVTILVGVENVKITDTPYLFVPIALMLTGMVLTKAIGESFLFYNKLGSIAPIGLSDIYKRANPSLILEMMNDDIDELTKTRRDSAFISEHYIVKISAFVLGPLVLGVLLGLFLSLFLVSMNSDIESAISLISFLNGLTLTSTIIICACFMYNINTEKANAVVVCFEKHTKIMETIK